MDTSSDRCPVCDQATVILLASFSRYDRACTSCAVRFTYDGVIRPEDEEKARGILAARGIEVSPPAPVSGQRMPENTGGYSEKRQ